MANKQGEIVNLVERFECRHCYFINFVKGIAYCNGANCTCEEKVSIHTILDLYANLYFHLDNVNIAEFETVLQDDRGTYRMIFQETKELWHHHAQEFPYKTYGECELSPNTIQLFKDSLLESETLEQLLLKMMSWLFILDDHLEHIAADLEIYQNIFELKTERGILIRKNSSVITDYLLEEGIEPPVNPNYILLMVNIKNFQLVQNGNSYYEIRHQMIQPFDLLKGRTIKDIKVAFLPGVLTFEDYIWDTGKDDENGNKSFCFKGIKDKEEYYQKIEQAMLDVLKEEPTFVILPELSAPWELQERMKGIIQNHAIERIMKGLPEHVALLIPGSFHEKSALIFPEEVNAPERVYNVSSIALGDGNEFYKVSKMNKFKIVKDENYKDALAPFKEYNGIEKNAYNKREITIVETPIGRMAILICVDLLNLNVEQILTERHVTIIFAMTLTQKPSTGKFLRRMQELGERAQATVIICNNTGSFQNSDKIVAYFPGIKQTFTSDRDWAVYSLEEMMLRAKIRE